MEETYSVFGTLYLADKGHYFLMSKSDFETRLAGKMVASFPMLGTELKCELAQDAGCHEGMDIDGSRWKALAFCPGITPDGKVGVLVKKVG